MLHTGILEHRTGRRNRGARPPGAIQPRHALWPTRAAWASWRSARCAAAAVWANHWQNAGAKWS